MTETAGSTAWERNERRPTWQPYVVSTFVVGQYVELLVTIQSSFGDSIQSGTRAVVREVGSSHRDGSVLIEFLESECVTGELAWLDASALAVA